MSPGILIKATRTGQPPGILIKVTRTDQPPGILIKVVQTDQPLPIEMEKFKSVSEYKESFQQFFSEWVETNCCDNKTLYIGRSHREEENMCLLVSNAEKESLKTSTQMHP